MDVEELSSNQRQSTQKLQAGLILLVLTLIIVGSIVLTRPTATSSTNASTPSELSHSSSVTTTQNASDSSDYKDGIYNATGSYDSPGGLESLNISVTLKDNVVTASSVVSDANDPTATSYQTLFINGYKPYVVGKKIDHITVSNVSGSSLTSQGFTDALKKIELQAKA